MKSMRLLAGKTSRYAAALGALAVFVALGASSSWAAPATDTTDDFADIISGYQQQIQARKDAIAQMRSQMDAYQKQIDAQHQQAVSLSGQLAILENKVAKTKLDIRANQEEIDATNLEIADLQAQIQDKTKKIMSQRAMVGEHLRVISKSDARSSLDVLLTQNTISEFFNDVQFLQQSQRELQDAIKVAKTLKTDLETRESQQAAKRRHLEDVVAVLEQDQLALGEDQQAKKVLQTAAEASETRYRYQLAALKREADNANSDITEIEKKLRKTLDDQRLRQLAGGPGGWGWPVDPARGLSAIFHDPDYPFRYVYEHPAVDVRVAQGTPVKATKGGYVAQVKNGGMGYSYVMLMHDGGITTVYGHLSRIIATEGTYVEKGDVIGYSGGTPGTPGAGGLTTGPHLHLEFRLNGVPVDPLKYLKL